MNAQSLAYTHHYRASESPDAPTLLLLHGTGGDENDLLPIGPMLAANANILSPRGNVLERGMARFFRRLAEGVFDEEDVVKRAGDLAKFAEEAASVYGFDPERLIAVGYSNGANIAAVILLLHPEVFSGALLFHPMIAITPGSLPDLNQKRVLLSAGKDDPIVLPSQTKQLAELLRSANADVTLEWERGGHSLTASEITTAAQWLNQTGLI